MLSSFVSTENATENSTTSSAGASGRGNSVSGGPTDLIEGRGALDAAHTPCDKGGNKESNDNNSSEAKQSSMSPFSMPGVLHFLQQEWNRNELDRAQWEIERSELKARISFLIGERKSQENLKNDLVRRIKMLEYALKQERAKFQQMKDGQENFDKTTINLEEDENEKQDSAGDGTRFSAVPFDIDAILPAQPSTTTNTSTNNSANANNGGSAVAKSAVENVRVVPSAPPSSAPSDQAWAHARETLRQYLQEIGYTEHMLEARFSRVKQLLGIHNHQQQGRNTDSKQKDVGQMAGENFGDGAQVETEKKIDGAISSDGSGGGGESGFGNDMLDKFVDIKSGFEDDEDATVLQLRWNNNHTLRSHYDSVRAMQFHPVEPMLITASEDGTAKLWDLNHSSVAGAKNEGGGGAGGGSKNAQSGTGIVDIEPLYTFRGHRGPVLALDLAPLGETFYTGGLDGTICCWTVPQTAGLDIYQTFDPSVLQERLCGHTDAVWCLCFHASSNRLISASADGTIRIWIVGLADGAMPSPLLKTIEVSAGLDNEASGDTICPHSIDLVSTADRQQLLCAYQGGGGGTGTRRCCCNIRDLETGQVVVNFQLSGDDQPSALNKILSHPTMPVSIAAGEDRKIRFFDNNTGKLISAPMAHVEGVSTLAIDPYGLYMLSGSHDGSVRLWNAEKRVCLQEIAAHRKKFGAGVMAVAFHPSRQLIGSSGADSLAKVYSPIRQSPRSSVVAAFGASPSSSPGSSGHSSVVGSPQKSSPPISSVVTPAVPAKNK